MILQLLLEHILKFQNVGVSVYFHESVYDFKILVLERPMKLQNKSFSSFLEDVLQFSDFSTKNNTLKSF